MSEFLVYLVKANLILMLLYLVFYCFFRNTTLHQLNRIVLLSILLISVSIPLIHFNVLSIPESDLIWENWAEEIEFIPANLFATSMEFTANNSLSLINAGKIIYLIVLGVLLLKFVVQIFDFNRIRNNSTFVTTESGKYLLNSRIKAPFAFLKWIFIPEELSGKSQLDIIIAHEKVHARQLHTLDLLIVELFCIVFWFNPFVFLLKRSLKTVHEYTADQQSVKSRDDKIEFLGLLASGVEVSLSNGVSSNFYWSTLKKRINMITKNKTTRLRKLSYLLLIPVIGFVFMSFSGFVSEPSFISTMKLDFGKDIPSIHPLKTDEPVKITSGYGMRMHPIKKVEKMHYAVDFKATVGTPIVATANGVVIKKEYSPKGYGRFIIIKHSETYSTLYSQMSEFKVDLGDEVVQGQIIGLVGSSGVSTGPHLHYEIKKDGKRVNPADYIPELIEHE